MWGALESVHMQHITTRDATAFFSLLELNQSKTTGLSLASAECHYCKTYQLGYLRRTPFSLIWLKDDYCKATVDARLWRLRVSQHSSQPPGYRKSGFKQAGTNKINANCNSCQKAWSLNSFVRQNTAAYNMRQILSGNRKNTPTVSTDKASDAAHNNAVFYFWYSVREFFLLPKEMHTFDLAQLTRRFLATTGHMCICGGKGNDTNGSNMVKKTFLWKRAS